MTSCVVAVATMALLLPGLSCSDKDSPDTNWTPSSVTVTLSSCTLMLLSARTEDVRGDSTCNTRQQLPLMTVHKDPRWHCHCVSRGRVNFAGGHCCWQWCHWCLKPALSFVTKRLCGSFFEILVILPGSQWCWCQNWCLHTHLPAALMACHLVVQYHETKQKENTKLHIPQSTLTQTYVLQICTAQRCHYCCCYREHTHEGPAWIKKNTVIM